MCGLFELDQKVELAALFRALSLTAWPTGTFRPTDDIPMVFITDGERRITTAQWWLAPSWATTSRSPYPTFNARSETAADKPTFRESVTHHRCLIPASAYYESRNQGGHGTPYRIHPESGVVAFAGLYSAWTDRRKNRDGSTRTIMTATILTRAAEGELAAIHDRMPVMVRPEDWQGWLDPVAFGNQEMLNAFAHAGLSVAAALAAQPAPRRSTASRTTTDADAEASEATLF